MTEFRKTIGAFMVGAALAGGGEPAAHAQSLPAESALASKELNPAQRETLRAQRLAELKAAHPDLQFELRIGDDRYDTQPTKESYILFVNGKESERASWIDGDEDFKEWSEAGVQYYRETKREEDLELRAALLLPSVQDPNGPGYVPCDIVAGKNAEGSFVYFLFVGQGENQRRIEEAISVDADSEAIVDWAKRHLHDGVK